MEKLESGVYVVAVSGGVDSMVLLHMLQRQPGLQLVVAHVNHGIRTDAAKDESFVLAYARQHNLLFTSTQLHLGAQTSESAAREARYAFLRTCSKKFGARGIVIAHHKDDMIETALLALLRGTGWRGLAPFTAPSNIQRPLLWLTKNDIIAYARRNHIAWREDSTNTNESYLRNYIRHTIVPLADQKSTVWRETFLQHIRKQQEVRKIIEHDLTKWLDSHTQKHNIRVRLPRYDFIMLPHPVAYELLQQAFRRSLGSSLPRPLAEKALLFIKTALPHKHMELNTQWRLRAERAAIVVELGPS